MNFFFLDFGYMLCQISFVDGLDISPIIFDSNFLEFSFILIVPGAKSSFLLFGPCSGAGNSIFPTVTHLDIERNALISHFGVAFDNHEIFFVFSRAGLRQITTFILGLVEPIEESKGNIFIFFMLKFPGDPIFILDFVVFKNAEVDVHFHVHCWLRLIKIIVKEYHENI